MYTNSTARLTLQPTIIYKVLIDGRCVFMHEDYQVALDYVLAWRKNHADKTRIRMNCEGSSSWRYVDVPVCSSVD
jgi:hypothetical protein